MCESARVAVAAGKGVGTIHNVADEVIILLAIADDRLKQRLTDCAFNNTN